MMKLVHSPELVATLFSFMSGCLHMWAICLGAWAVVLIHWQLSSYGGSRCWAVGGCGQLSEKDGGEYLNDDACRRHHLDDVAQPHCLPACMCLSCTWVVVCVQGWADVVMGVGVDVDVLRLSRVMVVVVMGCGHRVAVVDALWT